jgi:hypothetical protein
LDLNKGVNVKVKELLEAIQTAKEKHYPDIEDWDVAVEVPLRVDDNMKNDIIIDYEDWMYCKCHGFNTYMPNEKVFTINIHY